MAEETEMTIVGNLTRDPEVRFLDNGDAVCRFAIASTPRVMNRQTNEWKDGDPLFLECVAWRRVAENMAASIDQGFGKGARVIARGHLKLKQWEKDGQKHSMHELTVNEIGASLAFATVTVVKATKGGGGRPSGPQDDPWATASTERPATTQNAAATATPAAPAAAAAASAGDGWD